MLIGVVYGVRILLRCTSNQVALPRRGDIIINYHMALAKKVSVLAIPTLVLLGGATGASALWMGPKNLAPEDLAAMHQEQFTQQAALLGVTVEQVKQAWAEGKSMPELAESLGITKDELQAKMKTMRQERMRAHMQILVDRGVITQQQADQRFSAMEQRQGEVGKKGEGFMRHGHPARAR